MTYITQQSDLNAFMAEACLAPFLTVDTEFLREKTYYSKLCLVQIGLPDGRAAVIDVLAPDVDLDPVLDVLRAPGILKIFHAARQDLEIFYQLMGEVPAPLFDTQIAAMVCGHGEQVGYEPLVRALTQHGVDKTSQFTDWSQRPLSEKQIQYALGDVTHLVDVYLALKAELTERGREHWLEAEEESLCDPAAYAVDVGSIWTRVKIKSYKPEVLVVLKALAAWREKKAQKKDIPRTWIMRDETLADLAAHPPSSPGALKKIRGFPKEKAEGALGKELMQVVHKALATDPDTWPQRSKHKPLPAKVAAVVDVLKLLLKVTAAEYDVAPRVIASSDDLEAIALSKEAQGVKALQGWRREVFGDHALALKAGRIGIALRDDRAVIVDL